MIAHYMLKIAVKVKRIILFMLVSLLLFAPVKTFAYHPTITPTTITVMATGGNKVPKVGNFIIKEGLKWYEKKVKAEKEDAAKRQQKNQRNYERAKKDFMTKKNRLKKNEDLRELWEDYKSIKEKLTRQERLDLIKILDIMIQIDKQSWPFWGEYYNVEHEIQDKILSLYDKDCMANIKEYLEDPQATRQKYDINYTWQDKSILKVGFWIRYSETKVEDMDKDFNQILGGSTYDYIKNWLNKELAPLKEYNQKSNPVAPGGAPIAPGL